jgi:hypothetical protein
VRKAIAGSGTGVPQLPGAQQVVALDFVKEPRQ